MFSMTENKERKKNPTMIVPNINIFNIRTTKFKTKEQLTLRNSI